MTGLEIELAAFQSKNLLHKFYIKVKIVCEGNKNILKCIGFHEDEFV